MESVEFTMDDGRVYPFKLKYRDLIILEQWGTDLHNLGELELTDDTLKTILETGMDVPSEILDEIIIELRNVYDDEHIKMIIAKAYKTKKKE